MAWDPVANLKGPQGDPGSDANVGEHESATDPHQQYLTSDGARPIAGNLRVQDTGDTKGYQFRTNGGALDWEAGGASLYLSAYEGWAAGPTGTQRVYMILQNSMDLAVLLRRWIWQNASWQDVHVIDPATGVVFNEQGANLDFRVEGDTDDGLLFVDASADRVGIGTTAPNSKLEVNGQVRVNGAQDTEANALTRKDYVDAEVAAKPDLSDAFPTAVGEFNNSGTSTEASRADHVHSWSEIDPVDIGAANAVHNHDDRYYTETEVDTLLAGKQAAGSYASATHSHAISDVTNLQTTLDGKQPAGSYASSTHNHDSLYEPLRSVRTVNPAAGTISIDANVNGDTIKSTLSADAALAIPTNGFEDQVIQGVVLAQTAQRILTFNASFGRLTGIGQTLTIPAGKVGRYAIRRTDITGSAKWLVESVGVES